MDHILWIALIIAAWTGGFLCGAIAEHQWVEEEVRRDLLRHSPKE